MESSQAQETVVVAADPEEEMPAESEEQALALNADELQFWVKQVVIENIKLEKELEERKAARKMAADICRSGKPLVFPSEAPKPTSNSTQPAQTKPNKKRKSQQAALEPSPTSLQEVDTAGRPQNEQPIMQNMPATQPNGNQKPGVQFMAQSQQRGSHILPQQALVQDMPRSQQANAQAMSDPRQAFPQARHHQPHTSTQQLQHTQQHFGQPAPLHHQYQPIPNSQQHTWNGQPQLSHLQGMPPYHTSPGNLDMGKITEATQLAEHLLRSLAQQHQYKGLNQG